MPKMPKVNVNAFGIVNLKFAANTFNSTSFKFQVCGLRLEQHNFPIDNHQSTIFNGLRLVPQDLRALTGPLPATRSADAGRTPVRKGGVEGSYTEMAIFLTGKPPRSEERGGFHLKLFPLPSNPDFLRDRHVLFLKNHVQTLATGIGTMKRPPHSAIYDI